MKTWYVFKLKNDTHWVAAQLAIEDIAAMPKDALVKGPFQSLMEAMIRKDEDANWIEV